jgi:succinate dehydrogenase/fumarate reductase flavoprotein subunit
MTEESKEDVKKGFTRRQFIIGAASGVVVGATAGVAGGYLLSPKTPQSQIISIPSWDHTADVVVIGSGGAGLASAMGALESGASVIVLEKASAVGGTTGISGGGMWVPNNSLAVAQGLTDPIDTLMTYLQAVGGGQEDTDLLNTYLTVGPKWIDHLVQVANGALTPYLSPEFNDYYNLGTTRSFGHLVEYKEYGAGVIKAMKAYIDSKGATTMLSTPAVSLYQDSTGRVVGVKATSNGSTINIGANKGVILAAGGFDFDPTMFANYPRGPLAGSVAVKENTGDGIKMAMAVGASIRNMNNNWGVPLYVTPNGPVADWAEWRTKPGAIIVNSAGKRFVNESSAYPVCNRAFLAWDSKIYGYPNIPAYTIMDSNAFNTYGLAGVAPKATAPSWMTTANTIQDLATALQIDPTALQATVAAFNANAVNGVDPDFNRGVFSFDTVTGGDPSRTDLKNDCLAPLTTPPFYAASISPGTCGTCGGPRINTSGQILDQNGNPIPGLYGAGNDIAAPSGAAYPGGGSTVGQGTVFGWIAGQAAASS